MVVGRVSDGLLEGPPRGEQPRRQAEVGDVVVADDDKGRFRHAPDPVAGGGEFPGQPLLRDVPGDQDQVGGRGVGVVERGGAGVGMLAAEMHIRELQQTPQ